MPAAKIVSHADSVSPLQYFRNSGMRTICCVRASTSPATLADHPPKIRRGRLEVKDVTRPLKGFNEARATLLETHGRCRYRAILCRAPSDKDFDQSCQSFLHGIPARDFESSADV